MQAASFEPPFGLFGCTKRARRGSRPGHLLPLAHCGALRSRLLVAIIFTIFRSGSPFVTTALQRVKPFRPLASSFAMMTADQAPSLRERAVVMSQDGDEKMSILIPLLGRTRNLNRPKDEPLAKVLMRIRQSAVPPPPRGRKNTAKGFAPRASGVGEAAPAVEPAPEIECALECTVEGIISEDTRNEDAWQHGRTLRIGDARFAICVNPPAAEDLKLPPRPLAGVPQRPGVSLRFAAPADCRWQWFRAAGGRGEAAAEDSAAEEGRWEPIGADAGGCAFAYSPRESDVGRRLRIECTPRRAEAAGVVSGELAAAETAEAVARMPAEPAWAGRHELAAGRALGPRGVRIVSYNLLASAYADTPAARESLFGAPSSSPPRPPLAGGARGRRGAGAGLARGWRGADARTGGGQGTCRHGRWKAGTGGSCSCRSCWGSGRTWFACRPAPAVAGITSFYPVALVSGRSCSPSLSSLSHFALPLLQELDARAYREYFAPHLAAQGLAGLFSGKAGAVQVRFPLPAVPASPFSR
jgi:hypothetical protein